MTNELKVTYGADPEFFVLDREKDKFVPACGLFGGRKGAPLFLSPDGGFLEDGTAVELNVAPQTSFQAVRSKIRDLVLVFEGLFPKYRLVAVPSVVFKREDLKAHPKANELGCSPDLWAWGVRNLPQINKFKNRRFAGGHIHIGLDPWPEDLDKKFLVQYLDFAVLTTCAKYISADVADHWRWEFYGHPGLYRETGYGIEWRSPDNMWARDELAPDQAAFVSRFPIAMEDFLCWRNRVGGKALKMEFKRWLKVNELWDRFSTSGQYSPRQFSGYMNYYNQFRKEMYQWSGKK